VVLGIVKHDHCTLSPVQVFGLQMIHKLHEEERKRVRVGLSAVSSIEELSTTTECADDVHCIHSSCRGHLILDSSLDPASLSVICKLDY